MVTMFGALGAYSVSKYVFSTALMFAQVEYLVALEAALSESATLSASTGVDFCVPAAMSAPQADQTAFLRFTHIRLLRTLPAALSISPSSSASAGVVLVVAE